MPSNTAAAGVFALFACVAPALAQPFHLDRVAATGQPAPGTAFSFTGLSVESRVPTISHQGRIALTGDGGGTRGIWVMDRGLAGGPGPLQLFALNGAAITGGLAGDTWRVPVLPLIDAQNRIAGTMSVSGGAGTALTVGTPGQLRIVARTGMPAPGLGGLNFGGVAQPAAMNPAGTIAFTGGSSLGTGIWINPSGGATAMVLAPHGPAPGLQGPLMSSVGVPTINGAGVVAFTGELDATSPGASSSTALVAFAGPAGDLRLVARQGDQVGATGEFFRRAIGGEVQSGITINDSGTVAMWAGLNQQALFTDQAIVAGHYSAGASGLRMIARAGNQGPGMAAGEIWNAGVQTFAPPLVNAAGDVVFWGGIRQSGGGGSQGTGLWMERGGQLALIARDGMGAGFSQGEVLSIVSSQSVSTNGLSDVVFQAILSGPGVTAANERALYAWSPLAGFAPVVRTGQLLEVSPGVFKTLSAFDLMPVGSGGSDGRAMMLNDRHELVFTARFTDGSSAIYVTTVPAPISLPVLVGGLAALGRRRHRSQR